MRNEDERNAMSFRAVAYVPLHTELVDLSRSPFLNPSPPWRPSGQVLRPFKVTKPGRIRIDSRARYASREVPIYFTVRTLDRLLFKAAGDHGSFDPDSAQYGAHLLRAVAYDASGNPQVSDAVPVTVADLSPPIVNIELPLANAVVGDVVHVEASASDNRAVTAVELRAGDTVIGTATSPPWAIAWDTAALAGPVTLVAVARDGNASTTSSPVTVTVDNAAPSASITSPTDGASVSGRSVIVTVDAADDHGVARVDVFAAGVYVDTATWDDAAKLWVLAWNSAALPNGPVALTARAYDLAGNAVTSAPVGVEVADTTAPTVALTSPAAAIVRGVVQVAATASDDGVVAEVAFLANGTPIGVDAFSPYEVPWDTTAFPDGPVTLAARAKDGAGNAAEATFDVVVDNSGPTVSIDDPPPGGVHGTVTVRILAADPSGVDHIDVYAGALLLGAAVPVPLDAGAYSVTWQTTAFDNRSFTLTAVAHDAVGNVSTSAPVVVTVDNLTTAVWDAALGGSLLRAGRSARVELRVFASAAWIGERIDLFTSANPAAPCPRGSGWAA